MDQEKKIGPERRHARRQRDREIIDFFANANIGMHWVSPDGMILWANPYELEMLGYQKEEFVGHLITEFHSDKHLIHSILEQLTNNERIENCEMDMLAKDGSRKYVTVSCNAFWDNDRFVHARFFIRDITLQKTAEETIKRKEEELRSITDTVPALMAFIDLDQRYRFNNDAYRKWFDEPPQDIYGKHVREVIGEKSYADIRPHLERALRGEQTAYETEVILSNGEKKILSGVYTPRFNKTGKIEGVVSIVSDITSHKEAELKVHESEQRFHTMADTAPVMIWTARPDQQRDYFNKSWLRFTGKPLEQEIGWGWVEGIHSEDRERVLKIYSDSFQQRKPFRMEYRLQRHDAQYHWMISQGVPRFTVDGKFIGYIGSVIDIQDRKEFEEKISFLAEASSVLFASLDYEATLQNLADLMIPLFADWCTVTLFESGKMTTTAVAHKDPDKITWAKEIEKRYPPDPYSPHGLANIMRTGRSELYTNISDHLLRQASRDEEHYRLIKELGLTSVMLVPLKTQGKVLGAITFIRSESQQQYTPQDLVFAEELARNAAIAVENAQLYQKMRESDSAKTQFLSMLAHELRNPMAPILSSLDLLQFQSQENTELHDTVRVMLRQVKQMSRLLDDLLDVSRIIHGKIHLTKKEVDLNTVIAYAIETTRPIKEEYQHTLSVSLPSRPIQINADPDRLEQIIINLLNNAYKYTEPKGTVWLTVTEQNKEAVIRVKDTGIGIAHHMLPRIFDLFSQVDHTLSRSRGGMGIGLTLVKNLTEMHGGTIAVESAGLGKGTEFIVRLPIIPLTPQPQGNFGFYSASDHTPPAVHRTTHRILVIDDNHDAADALGRLLQRLGHEVKIAYDGPSGIEVARAYLPGVILLDIGLPEMNGYEVARRLRQESALGHTMLVAVSGYGQEEDKLRSQEAGFDYHFTKPIGIDVLNEILV